MIPRRMVPHPNGGALCVNDYIEDRIAEFRAARETLTTSAADFADLDKQIEIVERAHEELRKLILPAIRSLKEKAAREVAAHDVSLQ